MPAFSNDYFCVLPLDQHSLQQTEIRPVFIDVAFFAEP